MMTEAEKLIYWKARAERRWIADVLKTRRCLCGADKTGCPE